MALHPWLGLDAFQGPAGSGDPMAQEVRAVLAAWREAFGAEAVTAADAIQRADPDPELRKEGAKPDQRLREAIELAALRRGKLDARALSYWLRAHRDVRVGTMRLRRADGSHGGIARWKVVT